MGNLTGLGRIDGWGILAKNKNSRQYLLSFHFFKRISLNYRLTLCSRIVRTEGHLAWYGLFCCTRLTFSAVGYTFSAWVTVIFLIVAKISYNGNFSLDTLGRSVGRSFSAWVTVIFLIVAKISYNGNFSLDTLGRSVGRYVILVGSGGLMGNLTGLGRIAGWMLGSNFIHFLP